ncbi:MerR family transcriptional regulator [Vibrio aquaticus]|uniref:MerR family transcriptional regulator n=1 Tax=Vibrio aquaticus TaxID=2496559 RepID=A0A432D2R1_9VIBR|nr:MerR family transcriptional regulator [Vibrio aquaticus]RTZ18179.1 MerR family transcriptional regulator [Vibrio aquaticus]
MDYEQQYAIREVSEITGVKPVTLRAWQRRYNLIKPMRTEKGHRLYSQEDIALIGRIQSWLVKGVPIGKVKALLESNTDNNEDATEQRNALEEVDTLLDAITDFNKGKVESIISQVLKEYPRSLVEQQFIQPTYTALNLVKYGPRVLQMGLFESVLSNRLISIIEAENKAAKKGKCLMVSCDGRMNISALFWALSLSERGLHVVMIEGVEDLSGLIDNEAISRFDCLSLFSSKPISASQSVVVDKLEASFPGELIGCEFIPTQSSKGSS